MTLDAFYDSFACTAGDCPFTCCQQWSIAVDGQTAKAWRSMTNPPGTRTDYRTNGHMTGCTAMRDGARAIRLNRDGFCPFLDENRLCRVVCRYGDAALPQACREFPRQIQVFLDRTERSLTAGCPEVGRLLMACGPLEAGRSTSAVPVMRLRDGLVRVLMDEGHPAEENLLAVHALLLRAWEDGMAEPLPAGDALEELRTALQKVAVDREEALAEQNELFLDLTDSYIKQGLYREFLAPLVEQAESLAGILEEEEPGLLQKLAQFETQLAAFGGFFCRFLANELSGALAPGEGLRELILMEEWTAMEYAAIRHALFLQYLGGKTKLTEENVIHATAVLCRIMGFCHEDIKEYVESAFESPVWDWGYAALLLA